MDNRQIKPKYAAFFKTDKKSTVLKALSTLRILGYNCPEDNEVNIDDTQYIFTGIDEHGYGVVHITSSDNSLQTWCMDCQDNFAYFLAVAAVNDENDFHQYFVVDETVDLGPTIGYIPKGSYSYSYEDKNTANYKYHKADIKELYEYFCGSKQHIEVQTLPKDMMELLRRCERFNGSLYSSSSRSVEWVHKWLRQIYHLYIYVVPRFDGFDGAQYGCHYEIYRQGTKKTIDLFGEGTYSYDEAMLTAIRECLQTHIPDIDSTHTRTNN